MDGEPLVTRAEPASWLHVMGDVDLSNADQLAAAIEELGIVVVADFSEVTFIDSAGFRVLVEAYDKARKNGGHFRVTGISGAPLRAIQVLDLEYLITGRGEGSS